MATAFKAGKVICPDAKWTGEEQLWHNWEKMSIEKFCKEKSRMLNFYGYYLTVADLKPAILAYMKRNGYIKEDIDIIRNANPSSIPMTAGKLIRALDLGMPSLHPELQEHLLKLPNLPEGYIPTAIDDHIIIRRELNSIVRALKESQIKADLMQAKLISKPIVSLSPIERLKQKVEREVIVHLEAMLDDWILKSDVAKVEPLSLTSFIRDGNIPAAGCKYIADWINRYLVELIGARDKTCEQLVEGYSNLSRVALKNRISNLEGMLGEISKVTTVAKTMRKPRIKKTKDATKQVARIKYQTDSKDYNINSINPLRIPGAQKLFVFNTKYRNLTVFCASGNAGFEIKGTSIKGFDDSTSFCMSLRKPADVLTKITSSTPKQIDKFLETLTTKRKKANGRISAQTLLIRTIETRS